MVQIRRPSLLDALLGGITSLVNSVHAGTVTAITGAKRVCLSRDGDTSEWGKINDDYVDGISWSKVTDPPSSFTAAAHAASHDHGASDALRTAAPVDVGTANTVGDSTGYSLANHVHKVPFSAVRTALSTATDYVSFNSQKITGIATPTASSDGANKAYVDANASGLKPHVAVHALAVANVASRSGLGQTIDGVALNLDAMRVLLVGQDYGDQNGAYVVHSGAWTRAADLDTGSSASAAYFFVNTPGTLYGGSGWVCTNAVGSAVVGTNALIFVQFSSAGQLTAGAGLTKSGTVIDVVADADGSLVVAADSMKVGVLATDAQHGARGGGTQHALAGTSAAGFLAAVNVGAAAGLLTVLNGVQSWVTQIAGTFITSLPWSKLTGLPTLTTVTPITGGGALGALSIGINAASVSARGTLQALGNVAGYLHTDGAGGTAFTPSAYPASHGSEHLLAGSDSIPGMNTGSGTINYLPKYTATGTTFGNSLAFEQGRAIGVGMGYYGSAFNSGQGYKQSIFGTTFADLASSAFLTPAYGTNAIATVYTDPQGIAFVYSPSTGATDRVDTSATLAAMERLRVNGSGIKVSGNLQVTGGSPKLGKLLAGTDSDGNSTWLDFANAGFTPWSPYVTVNSGDTSVTIGYLGFAADSSRASQSWVGLYEVEVYMRRSESTTNVYVYKFTRAIAVSYDASGNPTVNAITNQTAGGESSGWLNTNSGIPSLSGIDFGAVVGYYAPIQLVKNSANGNVFSARTRYRAISIMQTNDWY